MWRDTDRQEPFEAGPSTRYLSVFGAHWLLIAAVVCVAVAVAAVYVFTAPKRYEAHAQIVVTPLPIDDTTFLGIGLLHDSTQAQPVVTAAQLIGAPAVRQRVEARVGSKAHSFSVTPLGQSNVVDVGATASTPQAAAAGANLYARTALSVRESVLQRNLTVEISRLQSRLASLSGGNPTNRVIAANITQRLAQLNSLVGSTDPTLSLLALASPPTSSSWPRPMLSLLVAIVCGLLLGGLAALFLDRSDPSAKSVDDLRGLPGRHVLARVPDLPERELKRYVGGTSPEEGRYRDSFRRLRSALAAPGGSRNFPSVVTVCSEDRREGRTSTAVGLAKAIADTGRSVVLVDGDMRRATATSVLGASGASGALGDILRYPGELHAALVPIGRGNLSLVPAAADRDGPDLLASERLEHLFDGLREQFEVVVVDAPPLAEGPDGYAFAETADVVLVCARLGHTNRRSLRERLRRFEEIGAPPAGIVVVGGGSAETGLGTGRTPQHAAAPPGSTVERSPELVGGRDPGH